MMNTIMQFFKNYLTRLNTGTHKTVPAPPYIIEPQPVKDKPIIINILLFIITFITTMIAGASSGTTFFSYALSGLPYSLALMTILLCHEFGHYFAAKKFGVKATLPFFIPFPSLIGTMGAIIKTKSSIPHRRALFYIGTMGPLSGFVISCVTVIVGIYLSEIKPLPAASGEHAIPIFGDSLLFALLVKIMHGSIPSGHDIYLSPLAWAGWIGYLITSLNLMPIGQLDGSHILYALIGEKQKWFGWAAFIGLIIMSVFWQGWIVWIVLTLLILMVAHPEVPKGEILTLPEKALGWLCMVILIITFVPVPVNFL